MKSGKWDKIAVPSCWEQQGFGAYNYGHVKFEDRVNEEGKYKYNFNADEKWSGKHINLVFDGVMTDCEVKINGKKVGAHQGAFYQFKFDVSKLLKYGEENLLGSWVPMDPPGSVHARCAKDDAGAPDPKRSLRGRDNNLNTTQPGRAHRRYRRECREAPRLGGRDCGRACA